MLKSELKNIIKSAEKSFQDGGKKDDNPYPPEAVEYEIWDLAYRKARSEATARKRIDRIHDIIEARERPIKEIADRLTKMVEVSRKIDSLRNFDDDRCDAITEEFIRKSTFPEIIALEHSKIDPYKQAIIVRVLSDFLFHATGCEAMSYEKLSIETLKDYKSITKELTEIAGLMGDALR